LPLLFALTLFLSAALLFWIQPMVARMALPVLGGAPAVWNTCMLFFQAVLLAGYGYAHLTPAWLGVRRQTILHLGVLLLPLAVLPLALPAALVSWLDYLHPALGLLALLLAGVGLPFFVVATTAPLLQRWFAGTGHSGARDPYFLYAASNLGSMLALLAYPVVLEPWLHLRGFDPQTGQALLLSQPWVWTFGYGLLAVLILACAIPVWRAPPAAVLDVGKQTPAPEKERPAAVTWGQRLSWTVLAAVPSSLMLGATTYITTDVAPIPLLWVMPLTLYLLTFILAFARRELVPLAAVDRLLPLAVLILVIVVLSEATEPLWLVLAAHLLGLFVIALFCHASLAKQRPDAHFLTEFYFWLSLGGVLGGLFNGLIAPLVFTHLTEYPLVIVLACLARGVGRQPPASAKGAAPTPKLRLRLFGHQIAVDWSDVLFPTAVGVLTAILVLIGQSMNVQAGPIAVGLMFGLPAIICYTFLERPLRFGLGIGAVFLASSLYAGIQGRPVYQVRSFFGILKVVDVTDSFDHRYRRLYHGNTIHGQQSLDPSRRDEPLTYYSRQGPIGQVFAYRNAPPRQPLHKVAIVGLGAGTLATYGKEGQEWTYYEIDPQVVYIARDSGYFTFLKDSAAHIRIVEGDARLQLARADDRYDLLVIDAFSSDALPVHLFTREAVEVYLRRLREDGILVFHISNRYLNMAPMLAQLARDARLVCLGQEFAKNEQAGVFASQWVAMARPAARLTGLVGARGSSWWRLQASNARVPWTDDHADVLQLLKHDDN
jgi:SAM-dependent methyltransferase